MSFIVWDNKYSVGDDLLNYQHKKLFDVINHLHEAMLQGQGKEVLGEILTEMLEYTSLHFAAEEKYMLLKGYPGYAEHKKEHALLQKHVMTLFDDFEGGKPVLSMSVLVFLKDWLEEHILKMDLLYA